VKHLSIVAFLLIVGAYDAPATGQQNPVIGDGTSAGPLMTSVTNATYPPLALSANITGEVVVRLGIRKDGSVESAVVVSGHPLLAKAALESAQQSHFRCTACAEEVTPYSVTYAYQLASEPSAPDWPCSESHQHTTQTANRVAVVGEPRMVHPYFSSVKVRSAKCLYLWRCDSLWGGEDYYYFAIRSAKCLDLWKCGHQLREPFATCKRLHRDVW
jgi:TonB family protein